MDDEEEVHIIYVVSSKRMIAAMRACAAKGGQGTSYDHEAVKAARQQGLLVFSWWPAGHWRITDRGLNFIVGNESNDNEEAD